MEKEIKFQIEVESEKDLQKVHETLRVHLANLEMAGTLKIIYLNSKEQFALEEIQK